MNLPNFIVVGAAKSGTTSIYHYLAQHPAIFLSPLKETNFFATDFVAGKPQLEQLDFTREQASQLKFEVRSLAEYHNLFAEATAEQTARGEVSPLYLNSVVAAKNIKSQIPQAKLIAILRNPIERAYSGYQMQVRQTNEQRDFINNINPEEIYIRGGFYYDQIKRYLDVFDSDQFKIILFDDFRAAPLQVMQEIFAFLGVDATFTPQLAKKFNQGGVPKSKGLYDFIFNSQLSQVIRAGIKVLTPLGMRRSITDSIQSKLLTQAEPMTPEIRAALKNIYQDDIHKLASLLSLDLQRWLD